MPASSPDQPKDLSLNDEPRDQLVSRGRFGGLGAGRSLAGICGVIILALMVLAAVLNGIDDEPAGIPPSGSTAQVALGTNVPEQAATTRPGPDRSASEGANDGVATPAGVAPESEAATDPPKESIASSCPERCLIRVPAMDDSGKALAAAGTRASWTSESWTWAIATPDGISSLEADAEATLIAESAETLRLYMVVMPEGEGDDSLVEEFGQILDSVERYRLVQAESAPAIVTPLTDNGYLVEKILPAPPLEIAPPKESVPLANIDIGSLMEEVSSENLEKTILELQATSSADGSGVGTRYYSTTGNAMAAEYLVQRMESYGMRVWYEDFIMPEGQLLVNVVGEVPGRDPGAIYGMLSHYDTLSTDLSESPGADDNATGIAGSLEIARILSGYELEHPVRVIFVSAEEVGIVGADQFARRAVSEGTPYEGIFNVDAIGSDRQGTLLVLNTEGAGTAIQDLMVEVNDAYGLGQEMLVRQNPAIVADDNKIRDQGLAAVLITRELYGWSTIHHTPDDLIDYVSVPNTASATTLVLLSVASLVRE